MDGFDPTSWMKKQQDNIQRQLAAVDDWVRGPLRAWLEEQASSLADVLEQVQSRVDLPPAVAKRVRSVEKAAARFEKEARKQLKSLKPLHENLMKQLRSLEKDKEARYTKVADFAEALKALKAHLTGRHAATRS